ncbi:MAG: cytochrome b6-f complex iron-sulfur subunit [Saprospiraceae bacterium]|jgi:cytochrome b6-f complex iron-sulfur subunit
MNRKEFMNKLGIGAAFVLTSTCLGSCTRDSADPIKDLDFVIDLTQDKFLELNNFGSYIIEGQVVIARSNTGEYLAATLICSHEQLSQITYSAVDGGWLCTAHEARFSEDGEGLNANGSEGLQIFFTEVNGDLLRIFS